MLIAALPTEISNQRCSNSYRHPSDHRTNVIICGAFSKKMFKKNNIIEFLLESGNAINAKYKKTSLLRFIKKNNKKYHQIGHDRQWLMVVP